MFDMVSSGMCIFAQCVLICNIRVLTISFRFSIGLVLTVVLGVVGVIFLTTSPKEAGEVSVIPRETVETMRENVEWITKQR